MTGAEKPVSAMTTLLRLFLKYMVGATGIEPVTPSV